jgi:hypothetical protein
LVTFGRRDGKQSVGPKFARQEPFYGPTRFPPSLKPDPQADTDRIHTVLPHTDVVDLLLSRHYRAFRPGK